MVGYHGLSLSLGTRVEVLCECASQGGGPGPGRPVAEAHNHDMNTGARMCSQALMTVVRGVVLRERTSLKQPAQVLGSQDVWVLWTILVGGNIYL